MQLSLTHEPRCPLDPPKALHVDVNESLSATALLKFAEVLDARDLGDDAATARAEAVVKLRAKGNLVAVAHVLGP